MYTLFKKKGQITLM